MNTQPKDTHPTNTRTGFIYLLWRNMPRVALVGIILVIVLLMMVISNEKERLLQEKAEARAPEAKPINTVLLDLQPSVIEDAINLPGIIEPWIRLELMANISGSIIEVLVKEGDTVTEGQILAQVEPDDYSIALDSARASYHLAEAQYKRGKIMLEKRTIPQAELDKYAAQKHTAQAAVDDAELKLSRCTIKAPMQGVIRRLDAKVGLLLSIGDPVAEILQIDRVKAVVGIPETDVAAVRKITEVNLTIQALDDRKVIGRKTFFASSPETTARLYRFELELDNEDGEILPGMFFRAQVVKRTVPDALTVPLYSVITRNREQFVFVVQDGLVHKKPVTLGIIEKWQVQITKGLQAGDQVIVEGHRDVEEGQKVKIIHTVTDPQQLSL